MQGASYLRDRSTGGGRAHAVTLDAAAGPARARARGGHDEPPRVCHHRSSGRADQNCQIASQPPYSWPYSLKLRPNGSGVPAVPYLSGEYQS